MDRNRGGTANPVIQGVEKKRKSEKKKPRKLISNVALVWGGLSKEKRVTGRKCQCSEARVEEGKPDWAFTRL